MKIIALIVFLILGVFAYACIMAAATSDEQADKMYQEYQKWKQRKEKEKK